MAQLSNRKRLFYILPIALSALTYAPTAVSEPPSNRKWVKTFEDNFNGPLNTNIWKAQTGPWKDAVRVKENAFTKDGKLVLRTSKVGSQYRTGFLRTRQDAQITFSQKFGYFETRMKLDTARGQWAAFWLMPKGTIHNVNKSGRDGTEIDIVEGFAPVHNQTINQAIHYDGYGPSEVSILNPAPMNGTANQWHTYAVEWTPTKYVWYIDGKAVWSITDQNQISQVKQYMKLTTEVKLGTNWVGEMDDSKLAADTLVDYVRVWRDDGPASGGGGGSPPPPPPPPPPQPAPGSGSGPVNSGTAIEAENMTLARLRTIANNNASGDKVVKVEPGQSVGYAKTTYSSGSGKKAVNIRYVNNPGSAYIKLVVNGAVKKTWPLTGTGGLKTLSHTTYLNHGDIIQIKTAGAAHLDKVTFGSSDSEDDGSGSGGGGTPAPAPAPAPTSKSFEAEKMNLVRMTVKDKFGSSANTVVRVTPGQSMGLVETRLAGAGGTKTMKMTVYDQNRGDLVKFYVNGQIRKSWSMNGGGKARVLEYTGNINNNDKLTYKVWGTTMLDRLQY